MADTKTTQKYRINRVVDANGNLVVVHPETEAGQVLYSNTIGTTDVTNVDQALGALATLAQNSGVTGVKGAAESTYRKGNVNLTPANIGAVASNSDINAGTYTKVTVDKKGLVTGGANATLDDIADGTTRKLSNYIPTSQKGANGGVATLTDEGKVPTSQLPSYVDDVLEYANLSGFPTTGEAGKIYVDKQTNKTYRWSGTGYTEISASLALGETSSTAYAGDKGKKNADDIASIQTRMQDIEYGDVSVGHAEDADKLGGVDAEDYAKLTDIPEFVVTGTVTGTTVSLSKTYSEISTAITNNKIPILRVNIGGDIHIYHYVDDDGDEMSFTSTYSTGYIGSIVLTSDNQATYSQTAFVNKVEDNGTGENGKDVIVSKIEKSGNAVNVTRRAMTNDDLPTVSGLTAGSYSLVSVNTKGIVTGGNQLVQWGTPTNNTPSATLAVGGLFFELVE